MLLRWIDRIRNWLRGERRPHWCSLHRAEYNGAFYRQCPECLREAGPFHGRAR
jgi:hypothetical protein